MLDVPATTELPRDAIGVGLRPVHYPFIEAHWPEVGFFEIISENFIDAPPVAARHLAQISARYPGSFAGLSGRAWVRWWASSPPRTVSDVRRCTLRAI